MRLMTSHRYQSAARMPRSSARSLLAACMTMALAGAAGLTGCQEYASYPVVGGADVAIRDPNSARMEEMMTGALRWAVVRYPPPPGGNPAAAISLPVGIRPDVYERIAANVGPTPDFAVPVTAETQLPTYFVTRVWLRQTEAKVDILRPMYELGRSPAGEPIYGGATVRFRNTGSGFRVVATTEYELGTLDVPPVNPIGSEFSAPTLPGRATTAPVGTP